MVGLAISPVIKIAAKPEMYQRLSEDMDINAGRILIGKATLDEVGDEIVELVKIWQMAEKANLKSWAIRNSF